MISDDRGSLYSVASSSRTCAKIALPILYANLVKFPSDIDDEDRLAEDPDSLTQRLIKWSSLWKSLALSSKNPTSTIIHYAAVIKVLDLHDLFTLMEEFRAPRGQIARTQFFAGGLEEYNKVRAISIGKTQLKRLDVDLSMDSLTDLIALTARKVTKLIGYTPSPEYLHRWLVNMPALKALKMFSAAALSDEQVRDSLANCSNLKSLEIYHWPDWTSAPSDMDAQLASVLAAVSGAGLQRFVMSRGSGRFLELSAAALNHRHGQTLTELELLALDWDSFCSLTVVQNLSNLRSCTLDISHDSANFPFLGDILDDETASSLSQFFVQSTCLETLHLHIPYPEKILRPAIPQLHLKSLFIEYHQESPLRKSFWPVISSQSDTLERLTLNCQDRTDPDRLPSELLTTICTLHKLKYLGIEAIDICLLTNSEVGEIVANCPHLEEVIFASTALGNEALEHLAMLENLTMFHSR
jgi:hypothetical protein